MDIRDECYRRIALVENVRSSESLTLMEYELCSRSVIRFCNDYLWTYDPRTEEKHLPFSLYPFQEDALMWLEERYKNQEVGVIEKTRDMGVSWLIGGVWLLHKFIFEKGFVALIGSYAEKKVDDNTIDSIFGKLRYNLYQLPPIFKPDMNLQLKKGRKKTDPDSHLKLFHPNGNEIIGDSCNKNFGRGGRRSIVFLDEYAQVEQSDSIWSAVEQVAHCIIPVSTPKGKGNMFYRLKCNKKVPLLTLHWKDHPKKDIEWYEVEKERMEPHQVAQELDIDYLASKAGRVYKRADRAHHISNHVIHPNQFFEQFITWDYGIADYMVMIFGQITPDGVEIYAEYKNQDQDIEFFLPMAIGNRPPQNLWLTLPQSEQEEISNVIYKVFYDPDTNEMRDMNFTHYGDFSGTQRTANSRHSVKARMRQPPYDIDLNCNFNQTFSNRIQCFDNLLKLRQNNKGDLVSKFKISKDCTYSIDCLFNYIWDKEDINKPNLKPKHDEFSHGMSALEFFAINRFPVLKRGKTTVGRIR